MLIDSGNEDVKQFLQLSIHCTGHYSGLMWFCFYDRFYAYLNYLNGNRIVFYVHSPF